MLYDNRGRPILATLARFSSIAILWVNNPERLHFKIIISANLANVLLKKTKNV